MATNDVKVKYGTSFIFADVTDFPSSGVGPPTTGANDIRIGTTSGATLVQMDLTSLAASGGARESSKLDLGSTTLGQQYELNVCLEHAATPTEGDVVSFYWAASPNSTAASGNPGGLTGVDATFSDTSGILSQFTYIGSMLLRANVINIGFVERFRVPYQYGMLVYVNQSAAAMHTVMDETHLIMTELIDEIQAAA